MVRAGGEAARRLDGWKSIAGYFNRDRTTVMRWARERDLPVRRIPGGKQGSVFAFEHELASWALRQHDLGDALPDAPDAALPEAQALPEAEVPEAVVAEVAPPPKPRPVRRRIALLIGALLIALALVGAWLWQGARQPVHGQALTALPADPAVARDYVAARDLWARRTPADLSQAIRLYAGVIRREPRFAPAYAGMADAWLLRREYGETDEPTSFRQARRHAEAALALDRNLPGAHRALGFINYWWDGRAADAVQRFGRAIALDDHDGQTHFWYANILADLGEDAAAQREYDKARLLMPGSRIIEVEQACSHWQGGRDQQALAQLSALARRAPDDATIYNCLAWVHMSRGDAAAFARALAMRARLRGEPQLHRLSAAIDQAVQRDPASIAALLVAEGRREIASGNRKLRDTPAFYASALGDRAALVQLMVEAVDLGEQWYSAPVTRRITARWRGDAQVQRLLHKLIPPPVTLPPV